MRKALMHKAIDYFAGRYDYDASYMHALLDASPRGFRKFSKATGLANHGESVEAAPLHAAKLAGTLAEDCGPCTQLVADMAREAGVAADQIEAVLRGDHKAMTDDVALAWRCAPAVLAASPELDELRETVRQRWGDKGVVELTFALQASRLFPMVKLGLGYAKECRQVIVEGHPIPIPGPAA